MDLSPSWEAANRLATQEFTNILWNLKVHYHVHKNLTLIPILSHTTPDHIIPPSGLFSTDFPTEILYALPLSMRATSLGHVAPFH
jgi:hypothetical protein